MGWSYLYHKPKDIKAFLAEELNVEGGPDNLQVYNFGDLDYSLTLRDFAEHLKETHQP